MTDIHSNGLSPEITTQVKNYWANEIGIPAEDFAQPGTTIKPREAEFNRGKFFHYSIDRRTILRVDPALENTARQLVSQHSDNVSLAVDDIKRFFGSDKVALTAAGNNYFLDASNFTPVAPPQGFTVRQLPPVHDEKLMALFNACTKDEVEEDAEIYLDDPDPVIFGCFFDDHIVAYASHRYWGNNIADIGVLTHPEFRRRGLGKTVVSALSQWCLRENVVAMYRVDPEHFRSRQIAEALGYTLYMTIRGLKVV